MGKQVGGAVSKLITYEGGQARFVVEKSKEAGEIKKQVGGAVSKLITYEGGQARFVVEKSKDAGEIKKQAGGAVSKLITYEGVQARFVVEESKDAGEIKKQVGGAAAPQNINRELRNLLLGIGEKIRKTKVEEFGVGGVNHKMDVARVTTTDEAGRFRFK